MRKFPVLAADGSGRDSFGRWIPWTVIEVVREEALRAHSQSLETLAQRGGLTWSEVGNLFAIHFAVEQGIVDEGAGSLLELIRRLEATR